MAVDIIARGLAASLPFIDAMTDTWNDGAVTYTAIKMNVTDTASNAASLLLDLQVGGTSKFKVSKAGAVTAGGALLFSTDNAADIGAAADNRPRNGYFAGTIIAAGNIFAGNQVDGSACMTGTQHAFFSRGDIIAPADGVFVLRDNAATSFGRLGFGGSTSSYPALKRSTTVLQARLADDSDFAPLQGRLRVHANAAVETPSATHTLRVFDAAGTEYKILAVAA